MKKHFFKEINTFIQQGCIKLIKRERIFFKIVTKIIFHINAVLLNTLIKEFSFFFIKYSFHKKIKQHNGSLSYVHLRCVSFHALRTPSGVPIV